MIKEIIKKCNELDICEKRSVSDEYCEFVFYNKDIDKWEKAFTDILGTAVKPPGTKPIKEDVRLTESYGGVHGDQTLFKKELDDATIIAMFWPWQDHTHITLKIALISKKG